MKKAFSVFFITLMIFGSFSIGYCHKYPVYAEIQDENLYEPLRQQSDLVKAFQAYCKSRDLTIEGSALDAVTTWTTSAFNIACNRVGLNMTQIQAEIKAQYNANGQPFKYLFYATGVDAFNRIFAQFLQDNELEVGTAYEHEDVYDGKYYSGSLMYILDNANNLTRDSKGNCYFISQSNILQNGTNFKYTTDDLTNMVGLTPDFSPFSNTRKVADNYYSGAVGSPYRFTGNIAGPTGNHGTIIKAKPDDPIFPTEGFPVIYTSLLSNYYCLGHLVYGNGQLQISCFDRIEKANISDAQDVNIYIYAPTINNNTYEGDTIIYYPDGTVDIPDPDTPDPPEVGPDPDAPTDPLPPVDPDYPDEPVTPQTPPDWDIELPDFTDFDWIMTGLEKKFPWDIPFNIMFMMSLFVAEPEAPHFVGDIDLKVTTWHYDLDLAPFEEIAKLFRTFFFLGFILGLMLLTKQLIWG